MQPTVAGPCFVDHIDALRESFRLVRSRHPFEVDAIVVLPDHLHLLMTLPPDDAGFATRIMLIKQGFSRAVPADIHFNPVKHGHVVRASDWPHSSIHRHIERGWVDSRWGVSAELAGDFGE